MGAVNSLLRPAVTAYAGLSIDIPPGPAAAPASTESAATERLSTSPARTLWAVLIARIYEILSLICPECVGEMRRIAWVTEPEQLQSILLDIGERALPPPIPRLRSGQVLPARSPPTA